MKRDGRTGWPTAGAALGVVCVLLGCSFGPAPEPGVLRVGNGAEPQELDPHVVSGVTEHRILSALFEGLVSLDPKTLQPIPGVAESWSVSDDDLTYTFSLREDARWSNGELLTAADFVFSWNRILSPRLGSEYAYLLYCLKNARRYHEGALADFSQVGVRALDARTLRVDLEHPTPYFLSMQNHFAWYPVHRESIARYGPANERGTPWTRPGRLTGNGPFLLADWRPNEVVQVRRNPHYWNSAQVALSGVDFFPIDNQQTEERSFRSGLLHLTSTIPLHRVDAYRRERPEVLNLHPYFGSYFYRINVTREPFDDPRVRRALAMALDREELARNVLKGGETAATRYVPPGIAGYAPDFGVVFDPERARALLAEAGFPDGRGMRPVEILYNTSEAHRIIAEAVQRMWREHLGVDVRLLNQDWKVYLVSMNNLDYDVARSAWIGDVADPINFLECFQTGVGNNRTGWSSPEFDSLIQKAYHERDAQSRHALLARAEAVLLEDGPVIPIYFYTWKFLKDPAVQNLIPNILGYIRWQDLRLAGGGAQP